MREHPGQHEPSSILRKILMSKPDTVAPKPMLRKSFAGVFVGTGFIGKRAGALPPATKSPVPVIKEFDQFSPGVRHIIENQISSPKEQEAVIKSFKEAEAQDRKEATAASTRIERGLHTLANCDVLGSKTFQIEARLLHDPIKNELRLAWRPVKEKLDPEIPPEHQWRILHVSPQGSAGMKLMHVNPGEPTYFCGTARIKNNKVQARVHNQLVHIPIDNEAQVLAILHKDRATKQETRAAERDIPLGRNESAMRSVLSIPALKAVRSTPSPVAQPAASGDEEEDFTEEDLARLRGEEPVQRERMRG